MNKYIVLVFLSSLVLGCSSSKVLFGDDGKYVTCSSDIAHCYAKAKKVCGGKYEIVNSSIETTSVGKNKHEDTKLLVKCSK